MSQLTCTAEDEKNTHFYWPMVKSALKEHSVENKIDTIWTFSGTSEEYILCNTYQSVFWLESSSVIQKVGFFRVHTNRTDCKAKKRIEQNKKN